MTNKEKLVQLQEEAKKLQEKIEAKERAEERAKRRGSLYLLPPSQWGHPEDRY